MFKGLGFRVWGVSGLGFRGLGVSGLGLGGFRVQCGFRVLGAQNSRLQTLTVQTQNLSYSSGSGELKGGNFPSPTPTPNQPLSC